MRISIEEASKMLKMSVEEIAFRKAGSYSIHICVKGTAYCGRVDSDGHNIESQYASISTGSVCGTCSKRFQNAVAKVGV